MLPFKTQSMARHKMGLVRLVFQASFFEPHLQQQPWLLDLPPPRVLH